MHKMRNAAEIQRRLDEYLQIKADYRIERAEIMSDSDMSADEKRKARYQIDNINRLLNVRIAELRWVLGLEEELAVKESRKRICIGFGEYEGKCQNEADTPWTPYWCSRCDKLRQRYISDQLDKLMNDFAQKSSKILQKMCQRTKGAL